MLQPYILISYLYVLFTFTVFVSEKKFWNSTKNIVLGNFKSNEVIATVAGHRKTEVGLVVLVSFVALTKVRSFAKILLEKLKEKQEKFQIFHLQAITKTLKIICQETFIKYFFLFCPYYILQNFT